MINSFTGIRACTILFFAAILALGGCAASTDRAADAQPGFIAELPEQVAAVAAPGQNLAAVRVMPEDGCYWYLHLGPVENTMLPLRTVDGRMICTQPAPAVQAAS